jgi:hypothetical protein
VLGNLLIICLSLFYPAILSLLLIVPMVIFIHATVQTKEIKTSLLAVIASFVQLFGYGLGFLSKWITKKASKATQKELYG